MRTDPNPKHAPTTLGRRLRERDGGWFRVTEARHEAGLRLGRHTHRYPAITIVRHGSFGLRIGGRDVTCTNRGVFFKLGDHAHANEVGTAGATSLIVELRADERRLSTTSTPARPASGRPASRRPATRPASSTRPGSDRSSSPADSAGARGRAEPRARASNPAASTSRASTTRRTSWCWGATSAPTAAPSGSCRARSEASARSGSRIPPAGSEASRWTPGCRSMPSRSSPRRPRTRRHRSER